MFPKSSRLFLRNRVHFEAAELGSFFAGWRSNFAHSNLVRNAEEEGDDILDQRCIALRRKLRKKREAFRGEATPNETSCVGTHASRFQQSTHGRFIAPRRRGGGRPPTIGFHRLFLQRINVR
jgi:hypothetical protein